MNFPLIVNLVAFVALLLLVAKTGSDWSRSKQVLFGLATGVLFGL
ncbi:sodium:dicarboxylate symporter, partial [Erwinia amylovora]|nr:sodium:dicarboxylate symporter [Erwinia amylovora]